MKHVNIPVFIPHLGCPNNCVFCDQRAISGSRSFSEERVRDEIERVLATCGGKKAEIAFFGGSFTGIDRGLMIRLLDTAEEYVRRGAVSGIRMSTRPDYISPEIISVLKNYTVSSVELGIQSMSERVLRVCRRGHLPDDSVRAVTLLRDSGFTVGGQMMVGLPGSTAEDEVECACAIRELGASEFRIYPTVVFKNTEMYEMMLRGEYVPLIFDEAVRRSAEPLGIMLEGGLHCLRIGLHQSENLHDPSQCAAGPTDEGLGEAVWSERYRRLADTAISKMGDVSGRILRISVMPGEVSKMSGKNRWVKEWLTNKYGIKCVKIVENSSIVRYNIRIGIDE
jgi:histone acetyltransferase (RNA polymerase elongator complex component)